MALMMRSPSREVQALRSVQTMNRVAADEFKELIISHISRRLDLDNEKLDELINGIAEVKNPLKNFTKASLKRIASPFHSAKKDNKKNGSENGGMELSWKFMGAFEKLITSLSRDSDLRVEGLFRKSGNCTRVKELRHRMLDDSTVNLDLDSFPTHDRAAVLKQLLRDMPEPLLLGRHFEAFSQAVELGENSVETGCQRCLRVMQLLMLNLPRNNATIARRLLVLLSRVADEEANKMDAAALATVFAPHLLCSKQLQNDAVLFNSCLGAATKVVRFLVINSTRVFHVPPEVTRDVVHFFKTEGAGRLLPHEVQGDESVGGVVGVVLNCNTPLCKSAAAGCNDSAAPSPVVSLLTFSARSSEDKGENTTLVELAKLQAHINTMAPEARRKISKQLNHVQLMDSNGQCTPAGTPRDADPDTPRKRFRSKSVGASIRKRLPIFKGKGRHHVADFDFGGSLTAVNIDYEETSNAAVVVDCKPADRPTVKRSADTQMLEPSPLVNANIQRLKNEEVIPPKMACNKENTQGIGSPFVGTAPRAKPETLEDTPAASARGRSKGRGSTPPLPNTENEREFLPAPHHRERLLHRVLSPLQCPSDGDQPTHGSPDTPKRSRCRSKTREPRHLPSGLRSVETSL